MKIYIIDDDITVIKMLENIIEDYDLGKMCGYSLSSLNSIKEINMIEPDIILVDLLMPEKDGISLIKELSSINKDFKFIMISHVTSKDLIEKAYTSGVEFFINKPINVIEVKTVISNVIEKIKFEETLQNIKNMFAGEKKETKIILEDNTNLKIKKIQLILNKLGMSGEKGATDIINVCKFLIDNKLNIQDISFVELGTALNSNSKTLEQRIRRAIVKGLSNIAHLGIEDYMNDTFTMYSSRLFNFEEVKAEMDFIRGKKMHSGKINIKKFIDGMMVVIEEV